MGVAQIADFDSCGIAAQGDVRVKAVEMNGSAGIAYRDIDRWRDGDLVIHTAVSGVRPLQKVGNSFDPAIHLAAIHFNLLGSGVGGNHDLGTSGGPHVDLAELINDVDAGTRSRRITALFLGGGSGHGQQDKASRRRGHVPNSCAHASLPTLRPSPLRARWKPSRRERPSAHRRSSDVRAPPHRRGRHLPPFWRRECKR